MMKTIVLGFLTALAAADSAMAEVQTVKHRITGLFNRERENDLREVVKALTEVTVVSVDFDAAEVTFSYDPAKLFPKMKEKDWLERFDQLLKQNSRHTFGAKPLCSVPKDKLERVEIAVGGNDCKGCDLSAYELLAKTDGVEQATASFKEGRLTALIDPTKTNKAALIDALKKRQVNVK
jgi:copper chaperone CopZ